LGPGICRDESPNRLVLDAVVTTDRPGRPAWWQHRRGRARPGATPVVSKDRVRSWQAPTLLPRCTPDVYPVIVRHVLDRSPWPTPQLVADGRVLGTDTGSL